MKIEIFVNDGAIYGVSGRWYLVVSVKENGVTVFRNNVTWFDTKRDAEIAGKMIKALEKIL